MNHSAAIAEFLQTVFDSSNDAKVDIHIDKTDSKLNLTVTLEEIKKPVKEVVEVKEYDPTEDKYCKIVNGEHECDPIIGDLFNKWNNKSTKEVCDLQTNIRVITNVSSNAINILPRESYEEDNSKFYNSANDLTDIISPKEKLDKKFTDYLASRDIDTVV